MIFVILDFFGDHVFIKLGGIYFERMSAWVCQYCSILTWYMTDEFVSIVVYLPGI
jgi:hypothetical protein